MKKLPILLMAAGLFAVTSCSDDDSSSNNGNLSANLAGTYELTDMSGAQAQDYDGDGDSSTNLVTEGACFNDSWISFHNDGTYDEGFTYSSIAEGGLSLECKTMTSSGTYTRTGNNVTTTKISGDGALNKTFTFDSETKTLKRTDTGSSYSGWNAATNLWASLTGNLQLTYTKYTDNSSDSGNGQSDSDNLDSSARAKLIGNFDMTAFIIGTAQDLDNDGDSSDNLINENNCYASSKITFKNDGTFTETKSFTVLGAQNLTLQCDSELVTGTWTRNGDKVITRHTSGNANLSTVYDFNTTSNVVSRTGSNVQYPIFNVATALFGQVTGDVEYKYTKN